MKDGAVPVLFALERLLSAGSQIECLEEDTASALWETVNRELNMLFSGEVFFFFFPWASNRKRPLHWSAGGNIKMGKWVEYGTLKPPESCGDYAACARWTCGLCPHNFIC